MSGGIGHHPTGHGYTCCLSVEGLRRVVSALIIQRVSAVSVVHVMLPEGGGEGGCSDLLLLTAVVLPYFSLHRFIGSVAPHSTGL